MTNGTTIYYSYIAEYSIDGANTWKKQYVILPIVPGGGTWDFTNGLGGQILFTLDCGSGNNQGVLGWQTDATYNKVATASQTHFMDTNTNVFYLANVQLEALGATPFEDRSFDDELIKCMRYYEKSYDIDAAPGSTGGVAATYGYVTNTAIIWPIQFKVRKRTTSPVMTIYSPATGASGNMRNNSLAVDVTASNAGIVGEWSSAFYAAPVTAGHQLTGHFTAEAEL